MIHGWAPPSKIRRVAQAPKTQPATESIDRLTSLIANSSRPLMIAEGSGQDVAGFENLVKLAELMAIPVTESASIHANFPKNHPMYLGTPEAYLNQCDLVLLLGSRSPWYPPNAGPASATVVALGENPLKGQMAYQNLLADMYVEGDMTITLRLLTEALEANGASTGSNAAKIAERREYWKAEHDRLTANRLAVEEAARTRQPIDPAWLCAAISEAMPGNTAYAEEVTSHRGQVMRHVQWDRPQSYFHPNGGLGQGLGLALGVKLAMPERPVVALMGDGGFLYNPVTQSFGVACEANLPFLTVIFNNGNYEAMRRNHQHYYPDGAAARSDIWHGVHIPGPDYPKLVEPFGGYGVRVEDPAELVPALQKALAAVNEGRIALVDVALSI
jgi:acetolactate synthase-1/2/3 large subunit